MNTMTHTHRRAASGTLIVRASTVAVGLAASACPQSADGDDRAAATQRAVNPSILRAAGANPWFAVQ